MNLELIPIELHNLINMVETWGLSDDGYRDEQLFNASKPQLQEIINSLPQDKLETLTTWLVYYAEDKIMSMTHEYVSFTCYLMAYDMSRVILEKN